MTRFFLSSSSILGLVALGAGPSVAASCDTVMAGAYVCSVPASAPLILEESNVEVTVEPAGSVTSDDANATPIALVGNDNSIANDGTIEQRATRDSYAITGEGDGLSIVNSSRIVGGDRGIEMLSGSDLSVSNTETGTIESRRQGVRSGAETPNAFLSNAGTIRASEGRAVQFRSFGATIVNTGTLLGREEVVEARGDFTLINSGTIRLVDESVEDEDGVQFASGTVRNSGTIRGTDDGIDVDEGLIENIAGGEIVSLAPDANDNSGIDVDEVYEDEINEVRPSGRLTIRNAGLIEGPSAIGTAEGSTSELVIENSGVLRGRGGTAIRMTGIQGASSVTLAGSSQVTGDVLFGAGDDVLTFRGLATEMIEGGIFDGRDGDDMVVFDGYGLDALRSFDISGDFVTLTLASEGREMTAGFRNFGTWVAGGTTYGTAEFGQLVAPVPLPAGLPLLLAGLGGFALIRRRR